VIAGWLLHSQQNGAGYGDGNPQSGINAMGSSNHHRFSRRTFVQSMVASAAATAALPSCFNSKPEAASNPLTELPPLAPGADGYNILFVFTDQERYFRTWPMGLILPGHDRLQRDGVCFHNHYTSAVMCTSSRSVLLTGLQTPNNGMFENTNVPYVPNLSPDIPTYGHMLQQAGYYTAYKGKWHLSRDFDVEHGYPDLSAAMAAYGFADYYDPGDVIGHTHGGYLNDHLIAGSAIRWLRNRGASLNEAGTPWCLTVSLVNPHDVMYFNTDAPGEQRQDSGKLAMTAARAPDHALYAATWDIPLPVSLYQPFDEPGRPQAHGEFHKMWGYVLGTVPAEEAPWRRLNDYYINCIRQVDQQITALLQELDALDLTRRTIVIFSSDHGEMAGAHGLRGKGPFTYEETTHLPFYVLHPDVAGNQDCQALTSHIDLVPTLLSMAGVDASSRSEMAQGELPGQDLTTLLSQPGAAAVNALREGILFTYSGLVTNDSELARWLATLRDPDQGIREAIQGGDRPSMKKRGSLRMVCDGRYKFTRYFAPVEHNQPTTLDELYAYNDVELYDLHTDPQERNNLGHQRAEHAELITAMHQKLERLIAAEIGVDDGRELPNLPRLDWQATQIDL
jgi:arylsulfatase A-like enzyme